MRDSDSATSNRRRRLYRLVFVAKLLLGGVLLALLLIWQDNGRKMIEHFRHIHVGYIALLFFIAVGLNLISSLKWQLFLRERGLRVGIWRLYGLYLIGKFFNNFMPSMVGGDLTRIYLLGRQIDSHSKSTASVFLERFTGMVALVLLVILFSMANRQMMQNRYILLAVLLVGGGCAALLFLIIHPRIVPWLSEHSAWIPLSRRLLPALNKVYHDIRFFRNHYRLLAVAMLYSMTFHLCTSVNVYVSCLAIEFQPSFLDVAVVTPLILLLNIIPVSPNNIGWWEWSFSVFLVGAGAGPSQGLAVALVLRAVSILLSTVGGVLFLFERLHHERSADAAGP